jgi:hypothetical protein
MNLPHRPALGCVVALLAGCSGAVAPAPSAAPPPESPRIGVATTEAEPRGDAASSSISISTGPGRAAPANAKNALDTEAEAKAPPPDNRPRLASTDAFSYIYRTPEAKDLPLGYVRVGTSVPLRSDKPVAGKDCPRGWYAVEPRGYVCLNFTSTLDLKDPYFLALQSVSPTADAVWYYRYAFSNGAPMYSRIPTREESAREDQKYGPRGAYTQLAEWSRGHEELLMKEPIVATDPAPAFFAGGKRHIGAGLRSPAVLEWRFIPNGSMVAYAKAFEVEGRVWLLTPDLMLVPADRVRQIRRSTFHGVHLGSGTGVELPLAWNRTKGPKVKYRRQEGKLAPLPDPIPAKTFVPISEDTLTEGGKTFLAVRGEPDTYVAQEDVTVSRARKTLPKGAEPGKKWIEVKILPGTLTAYEGDKPVFATLVSPGKGGVPVPGYDHTRYATTSVGIFPIEWKDHVATMTNEKFEPKIMWFTDVPHIQYLRAPLAMHVAFWHEDFGNPKSAECVNVAPEDGHFLFNWTDPALPEGWGAIRPGSGNGKSTPVIISAR